ncbi:hypothetical protein BS17DRAFT_779897 [Gyrodon lividus]|nr:hypothetical protein BS17DRAFT_779897 [Gyrodon lividus]
MTGIIFFALSQLLSDPYNTWRKCTEFFKISLSWPDRDFCNEYRMGRTMFDCLVWLLEANQIFNSTGRKPQRPV